MATLATNQRVAAPPAPARALGFWMALALVVGNLIGSGLFMLPATLAPLGVNQIVGWLVTIAGSMAMAYVFARLAARVPMAGGPYAWVNRAFGERAGFAAAWGYWAMMWAGNGAIAIAVVSNLSLFAPGIERVPGLPALLAVGCVWLLTLVNVRGVRAAGEVQMVTVVLKLAPLVVLLVLAAGLVVSGAPVVAQPAVPLSSGLVASAVGLTFWGFVGLESATVPSDKVEHAEVNVPRATLLGVALAGAIYLGIALAFRAYLPDAQTAQSPAPVADWLGHFLGGNCRRIVAVFAAISAFGALNGFVLIQGEVPAAMAHDGLFPAWFGRLGARGTPVGSHVVSSLLVTAVTLLNFGRGMGDLFAFIASLSMAAGMVTYIITMLAAIRLLRGERWLVAAALVSLGYNVWILWGLGVEAVAVGCGVIVLGVPVWVWLKAGQRKIA